MATDREKWRASVSSNVQHKEHEQEETMRGSQLNVMPVTAYQVSHKINEESSLYFVTPGFQIIIMIAWKIVSDSIDPPAIHQRSYGKQTKTVLAILMIRIAGTETFSIPAIH